VAEDWFWEGNIVVTLATHLCADGWQVESTADTASGEAGPDIRATRDGKTLILEAKGYPSTVYARGKNKGQPKRTKPATQARHWYAEALFAAILRQSSLPSAQVAIAFPSFPVYKALISRTRDALSKLQISVFVVSKSGEVTQF